MSGETPTENFDLKTYGLEAGKILLLSAIIGAIIPSIIIFFLSLVVLLTINYLLIRYENESMLLNFGRSLLIVLAVAFVFILSASAVFYGFLLFGIAAVYSLSKGDKSALSRDDESSKSGTSGIRSK